MRCNQLEREADLNFNFFRADSGLWNAGLQPQKAVSDRLCNFLYHFAKCHVSNFDKNKAMNMFLDKIMTPVITFAATKINIQ